MTNARQPSIAPDPRWRDCALFAALEISGTSWLTAVSAPCEDKVSKRAIAAGRGSDLVELLGDLQARAERRVGAPVPVVTIHEAALDGFWLHRLLVARGLHSHVVVPASIAVDRRKRRRKTDAIDVDALLRTVMAWARGERGVCSMVRPPSPEEEDRRRICREGEELLCERIRHTNRIKGLLAGQGVVDFRPLRMADQARLDELVTGDGRPLPLRLKAELQRQVERLRSVQRDLETVEAERDAMISHGDAAEAGGRPGLLMRLKGVGPEIASVLWLEALFRDFADRRQVAAYAGLAPSPGRAAARAAIRASARLATPGFDG